MAIRTPPLSVDDQEYYPLHEEDDVPETPPHEAAVGYARGALRARFPAWFVTGNVCVYWERDNTRDYRAPDMFVVTEPVAEPVTRVYQLWKQPPIAFALEVGPKVEIYEQNVKAAEYCHIDLDHGVKRLWRLGPSGYVEAAPEPNDRLRSTVLGLEFDLEGGQLQIYTLAGERLLSHEEEAEQRAEEARRRQEAEGQAAELQRQLADLQRQLADLRAQPPDPDRTN
jgi:hypothetical protein